MLNFLEWVGKSAGVRNHISFHKGADGIVRVRAMKVAYKPQHVGEGGRLINGILPHGYDPRDKSYRNAIRYETEGRYEAWLPLGPDPAKTIQEVIAMVEENYANKKRAET